MSVQDNKAMNKYPTYLLIIAIGTLFVSCRIDIDKRITKHWRHCPDTANCIVDMTEIIEGNWDTMYYFSNSYNLEDIASELGDFPISYNDVGDRIFFVKDKTIIYYKEWFPYPEQSDESIYIPCQMLKVTKELSKFKIKKRGLLYELTPVDTSSVIIVNDSIE